MRLSLAAAVVCTALAAAPAAAMEHGCGAAPSTPAHFDPATSSKDGVMAVKARFEAYQEQNGTFIDCVTTFANSDAMQGMKKRDRKKAIKALDEEINASVAAENAFADTFNANVQTWFERQKAQN